MEQINELYYIISGASKQTFPSRKNNCIRTERKRDLSYEIGGYKNEYIHLSEREVKIYSAIYRDGVNDFRKRYGFSETGGYNGDTI